MKPAHKCEGPGYHPEAHAEHQTQHADSASHADDVHERDPRKLQADYAAHLALKGGFTLHELAAGGFLICRWDRHHHCADLAGVRAFLARLGVVL